MLDLLVSFAAGVLASLLSALIWWRLSEWLRTPWSRRSRHMLSPSMRGARQLRHLIELLGNVYSWLDFNDTELKRDIQDDLWTVINLLSVEHESYVATYSRSEEERRRAIVRLSGIAHSKAKTVLEAIIQYPVTKESLRAFARQQLAILRERERRAEEDNGAIGHDR